MGRRVQKKVYTYTANAWSLTNDTLFVYDSWNVIQELDNTGVVQKSYVWGLDLAQSFQDAGGIGGLIASIDEGASKAYYFQYDANGNVGQLVDDSDGSIAAHYEYDPFGNLNYSTGLYADENPFRFSTKFFDKETSLYYYGYRYYSTELGRWLNRDPMGESGGINIYSFVLNDPINLIDLLGLSDVNFHDHDWEYKGRIKCKIIWDEPQADGDVIREFERVTKEGELEALFLYYTVEYTIGQLKKLKKLKINIPIPSEWFTYEKHHEIIQERQMVFDYWEICCDECNGECTKEHIGEVNDGNNTGEVVIKEWTEEVEIGK